ncbi:hypothetical protein O0I10_007671 [Lichtheimia ornata]|uniref:VHS domain-containing protein n=1 Tax=Lichtheimia ornata TaxID=688661 RepID=A0AAD7V0R9_9FUNG|nr:uncharacterized protein O0I10_007671 [Lichtheimia ornata]KAJ8656594.1 hypothetical protein O0I10_007671 [Lichtheimia ornata]
MGIFTEEVQKTSITLYIERLSNYEEIDWYIVQQLTESIQMQESGPHEAIEAVRKRLKHGTTGQKLRVIEVLKLLLENSNEKFRRQLLANDKMKERLDLIVNSSVEDIKVRKATLSMLGAVAVKFKNEPGMFALGELYEKGRNRLPGKASASTSRSSPPNGSPRLGSSSPTTTVTPTTTVEPPMPPRPQKRQSLPPAARKSEAVKTKPRSSSTAGSRPFASGSQRTFNLEKEKPKIINEVALANQNANNLVNALRFINTTEDRWEIDLQHDARLQGYRQRCEESKKKIVRYARLVEDEEWIGTLLATNEELLKAMQMYELMSVGEVPLDLPSPTSPIEGTTSPTTTRSPPPPPVRSQDLARDLADLQLTQNESNVTDEDANNPFADPVTPVEDIPAEKRRLG